MAWTLHEGDCLEVMPTLAENSIDAVITDPPYELTSIQQRFGKEDSAPAKYGKDGSFHRLSKGFMGKEWDGSGIAFNIDVWKECYRVLKPGAYLLAFGGTRTQHRMVCAIEDAGFEIRDTICWAYGSGFPKSLNIGKAVDKISERLDLFKPFANHYEKQRKLKKLTHNKICEIGNFYNNHNHGGSSSNWADGANVPTVAQWNILKPLLDLSDKFLPLIERVEREREVVSSEKASNRPGFSGNRYGEVASVVYDRTKGTSEWEGWGTALKPAHEPICVARKPLSEKTVAENVLKHGTGAINIDGSRVEGEPQPFGSPTCGFHDSLGRQKEKRQQNGTEHIGKGGRFPANLILDGSEEVTAMFPETASGKGVPGMGDGQSKGLFGLGSKTSFLFGDSGSAARYFKQCPFTEDDYLPLYYSGKASKAERNAGCEGLPEKNFGFSGGANQAIDNGQDEYLQNHIGLNKVSKMKNNHPTVKPLKLMEYLVNLVTTEKAAILDPFAGSGTTGLAAQRSGRDVTMIEQDSEYCDIIRRRMANRQPTLFEQEATPCQT